MRKSQVNLNLLPASKRVTCLNNGSKNLASCTWNIHIVEWKGCWMYVYVRKYIYVYTHIVRHVMNFQGFQIKVLKFQSIWRKILMYQLPFFVHSFPHRSLSDKLLKPYWHHMNMPLPPKWQDKYSARSLSIWTCDLCELNNESFFRIFALYGGHRCEHINV